MLITFCIGSLTEGTPDLTTLWFGNDSEVKTVRVSTFLAVFDLQDFTEDLKSIDAPLVAVICLVSYIAAQVCLSHCLAGLYLNVLHNMCNRWTDYLSLACWFT